MRWSRKRTAIAVAAAAVAVAVAGAGVGVAATSPWSPKEERQAVIDDAAKQLGVQPQALDDALKKALANRVDAAVAAGRITKEQGEALKQRIQSGEGALFGLGRPGFGHRMRGPHLHLGLDAAATYLGLGAAELRTQLDAGKSLADVAKAQGKSVDGLVDAMVAAEKKRLDEAVAAGKLTQAQADGLLAEVKEHTADLVNRTLPERRFDHRFRGFGGPGERAPRRI